MRASSILIVHSDRKTQRTVQRVLGVTGRRVDIADDLEQGIQLLAHLSPVLVVVDGALSHNAEHSATIGKLIELAKERGAEACMTLLGSTAIAQMPALLRLGAVTNLLVHQMPILAEELTITAQKLIRRDLFGAEKYLLWGTELHETTLIRGSQRAEVVGALAEQVRAFGQSARVVSMAMLVADELLSNAVHNAPIDAAGNHHRKDLARADELELDARQQIRLRWGCDARYLAIEVTDQFGTLDRDTILASLAKNDVRESGGGAGMGIALAYRSCDHLVFNLAPGVRTEIIALIDVRYPPTERMSVSSYNVFVERPRGDDHTG
ncbi:MAG: response regulator receiver protein [Deltaproteobacteria bacterium]|nr:response regulator receiver protein [Deltaproteobacteria bacterium]